MRATVKHYLKPILALILTVQAICLCCVFSACTQASAETPAKAPAAGADAPRLTAAATPADNYSRWLSEHYSADVATRRMWLSDMMTLLDLSADGMMPVGDEALFRAASELEIIDSGEPSPYTALTRSYVAATLVKAMDYPERTAITVADVPEDDKAMLTLVYYGYFVPDDENRVNPDAVITAAEYAALREELARCGVLKGKRLLSFGDSIVQGVGNRNRGVTRMLAEKYGMSYADYSVSRATMGYHDVNSHVADQIRLAADAQESGDLILFDGGTNDMLHVEHGSISEGFGALSFDEFSYAGGMETAVALIRYYWDQVPVLYIRAHNMDACDDETERRYGETALKIAQKWGIATVDIYTATGFNTEDAAIRDGYTFVKEEGGHGDTFHPTAAGYAKYYLPLIGEKITELLTGKA